MDSGYLEALRGISESNLMDYIKIEFNNWYELNSDNYDESYSAEDIANDFIEQTYAFGGQIIPWLEKEFRIMDELQIENKIINSEIEMEATEYINNLIFGNTIIQHIEDICKI